MKMESERNKREEGRKGENADPLPLPKRKIT